ncbi:hypothetical protein Clacol_003336 [Clathrus columnatus]|uniref:Fork-head domain-containing protein n=1 Tax=Clathrus columnatus TaxID=1419009 RepID=A0AAV5A8P6_9AGAM|nr:hypothetical protein Clacol_003336 [Clathrus columnatus]
MDRFREQAYQPYNRASRIEHNNFVHSFVRQNPHFFLPTSQDIYNPARQVYIPDTSSLHPVGKVTDLEYWLNPAIHSLPKAWLKYLETPLVPSNGFRCFELYPLDHHGRILYDWNVNHPGEYYPCEIRWNLGNLRGNVDDDCLPPYYLLTLIAAAIHGSPEAKATNKEIRLAIMLRYNYFITQSTLQEEVHLILNHYTLYFQSYPRLPTESDDGCLWGLTDDVARTIADTARNLPPPPPPIEPTVRLSYPKELDPGRTIVTGSSSKYSEPAQVRPKRLDDRKEEDFFKSGEGIIEPEA